MNKLYCKLALVFLAMGISISGWAMMDMPCMPIAQECMKAGFYKGGHDKNMGLIEDCVMPVTEKTKTLPNTNFTDEQLQNCKAKITEKMKEKAM